MRIDHTWKAGDLPMPDTMRRKVESAWYVFADLQGTVWFQSLDAEKPMAAMAPFGSEVGWSDKAGLLLEGKPLKVT